MTTCLSLSLVTVFSGAAAGVDPIKPGPTVEYGELAFYPERWKEKNVSTTMVPWHGERVVFLTTPGPLDPGAVTRFVRRIDAGWKLYAEVTGRSPTMFKQIDGKPVIAAVPSVELTCGYGCGMVGATGVELGGFYTDDYPLVLRSPKAFPHYVFYEIGRNFYTFGDRHSLFITGYAVFMRYICMDALGCEDRDRATRMTIEKAEALYAKAPQLRFLQAFSTLNWYVSASIAARRDLAPLFCDRWKFPLSAKARKAAAQVPWAKPMLAVSEALSAIPADFAP